MWIYSCFLIELNTFYGKKTVQSQEDEAEKCQNVPTPPPAAVRKPDSDQRLIEFHSDRHGRFCCKDSSGTQTQHKIVTVSDEPLKRNYFVS